MGTISDTCWWIWPCVFVEDSGGRYTFQDCGSRWLSVFVVIEGVEAGTLMLKCHEHPSY